MISNYKEDLIKYGVDKWERGLTKGNYRMEIQVSEVQLLWEIVDILKGALFLLERKDMKLWKMDYFGVLLSKSLHILTLDLSV